jgi:mannan endo-1,4-beta-mannosidase
VNPIRNTALLILALFGATSQARQGIVRTSDGHELEGDIRLESGAAVISTTNQSTTNVALEKIALLRFQSPPPDGGSNIALVHGLRGSYFHNRDLTGHAEMRIDPVVNFDWHSGPPIPGFGLGPFGVRWEGQIKSPKSEQFTFSTQTDGGVRLWVQNRALIDKWQEQSLMEWNGSMELQAGKDYDLKIDYSNQRGGALVKLFWSSPSVPRSIIAAEYLTAKPLPVPVQTAVPPAEVMPPKKLPVGIVLSTGSIIARRISSADETSVRFLDSTNELALSTINVARIFFQPMPVELEQQIQSGRAGLLLSSKEFVEGEFKGFTVGRIKISSVLFGIKTYDPGQVLAVILRKLIPQPHQYELKARDESLFLVNTIRLEKDSISLLDPALAGIKIPATELVQLKRAPSRE